MVSLSKAESGWLWCSLLSVFLWFIPSSAMAAPDASCALNVDDAPLLGESFSGSITLDNTGSTTGFAPAVEVFAPDGFTLTGATGIAGAATIEAVGTCSATTPLIHPLTEEEVSCPTGSTFYFIRTAFSGLAPSAPAATIDLTFAMDSDVALGDSLDVEGSCLFAFGEDALNNPDTDAPVRSDLVTNAGDQESATVTPTVLLVSKEVSTPVTVTGESWPVSYTINLNVADGATITGAEIADAISDQFQQTAVSITTGTGTVRSTVPSTPGGTVEVGFASITGTTDAIDAQVTITGYVPEDDALGDPVLDPSTGAPVTISNTALITDLTYDGASLPDQSPSVMFEAYPYLVRETVTNTSRTGGFLPGDTAEIELTIEVSDYFDIDDIVIDSVLDDGLTYVASSASLTPDSVTGDDPTTIVFDVGSLSGGSGTTSTITFEATVDEDYLSGDAVLGGDTILTTHTAEGDINGTGNLLIIEENDSTTDGSVSVATVNFTKTVYAINGAAPVSSDNILEIGDEVTFRLQAVLDTGAQGDLIFVDYLPSPIFDSDEHGASPSVDAAPATIADVAAIQYGPDHTLDGTVGVSTSVSGPSADNSITFDFDAFDISPAAEVVIDLLLTYTVSDTPLEDGLELVNIATGTSDGTTAEVTDALIASVRISSPELTIEKSVASSTNTSSVIDTEGDLTEADAGDIITFQVVIENEGSDDAFDVVFEDTLPTGLQIPAGGLDLSVSGASFTGSSPFSGGGLTFATVAGGVTITIAYELEVADSVEASAILINAAEISSFTALGSGTDFGPILNLGDDASVTVGDISIAKTLTGDTTGTIQDTTTYQVVVSLPEGTHASVIVDDALPDEMAYVSGSVVLSGAALTSGVPAPVVGDAGRDVSWDFGEVVVADSTDAGTGTITITYTTVVLNNDDADRNNQVRNTATVTWPSGSDSASSNNYTIEEARARINSISASPNVVDTGDTITYTVTIDHNSDSQTAHDLEFTTTLPDDLTNLGGFLSTGGVSPSSFLIDGDSLTVNWTSLATTEDATFEFTADVDVGVTLGSTVSLDALLTWTSQSGSPAAVSSFNTNSVERTGTGTPSFNDYRDEETEDVSITPIAPTKTLTSASDVVIGDRVSYTISFNVPEGNVLSAVITDTLEAGLVFEAADSFFASSALTCDGAACSLPTPTVSTDGQTVSWDLGELRNTDTDNASTESISFNVDAIVENSASAFDGATLENTIELGSQSDTSESVTVREPNLSTGLSPSATVVDAGDVVTFSATIAHTDDSSADAQDIVLTVALPDGLTGDSTSFAAGTCPAPTSSAVGASLVSVEFSTLADDTSCTLSFSATVDADVNPEQVLALTSGVVYSSLSGDETSPRSTFSSTSTERTGDTSDPGGALNDYVASGATSLTVDSAEAAKALSSTSSTDTTDPDIAFGEEAVYTISITLPEGESPDVEIVETPPTGFSITAVSLDTTGFTGSVETDPTSAAVGGASGGAVTFSLGTVTVTGNNDATDNTLVLEVTGVGTFESSLDASPQNQISLEIDGSSADTASAAVNLVTPGPVLSINVDDDEPSENDTVNFTATVQNDGDGPVCDATVTVVVPDGFDVTDPASDGADNDADGSTDEADEGSIWDGDATLTFTVAGCVGAGDDVDLTFAAVAASAIEPGTVSATASLGGYSTLDADGVALTPTGDAVDNDADGATDEADDGSVSVELDVIAPALAFEKTFTDTNGGDVEPGDRLTWNLIVRNTGTGPAAGVEIADSVAIANTTFVSGSESTDLGSVGVVGSDLTATIGTLGAGGTATVTFQVDVNATVTSATAENQANLATSDGYTGVISDDPSTADPDDITIARIVTSDADGDGLTDLEEAAEGTDPFDPDSDDDGLTDGEEVLTYESNPLNRNSDGDGIEDGVEVLTFGTNPILDDTDGDGLNDNVEIDDEGTDPLDADSDNDGLSDGVEVIDEGTNPLDADTDDDGLTDGEEVSVYGTDPDVADSDADGLNDFEEVRSSKTDPNDADSDDDGLSDGAEVNTHDTDPNVADSDGDGLSDGAEVNTHSTDPNNRDSDGGGVTDGVEVAEGTDPNDSSDDVVDDTDSDGDGLTDDEEAALG
ncbi:MAG: isopeptide-forming domain-containing fimbrial protein, partial [Myxococcota bacterium]